MKANERINEITFRPVKGTRYYLCQNRSESLKVMDILFGSPYEPYDIAHMIRSCVLKACLFYILKACLIYTREEY